MYYENSVVEKVRTSNSVLEVVSSYVKLTKKGNSYSGCCPFHNEKTPSFYVNEDKGLYHCFGCGVGGNVISFIMKIENVDFVEAVKQLAKRANIDLPEADMSEDMQRELKERQLLYEINKEAANYYYKILKSKYGDEGLAYITRRGLSTETIKRFGLGYAVAAKDNLLRYLLSKNYKEKDIEKTGLITQNSYGYYDRFFGRVIFPILNVHNNIIGFGGRILSGEGAKYLNSPETSIFSKRTNLYALNIAKKTKHDEILLVEGYMDVLSLHEAGFDNAVASLGTSLTHEQANLIKKYKRDVLIIYDTDNAGVTATFRAIEILKNAGLNVKVLIIEEAKDPDEYIKKHGSEKFSTLLTKALSYIEYEFLILKQKYNLNNPNDKKKFIGETFEQIKKINDELDKELFLQKLSEVVEIHIELLKKSMNDKKVKIEEVIEKEEELEKGLDLQSYLLSLLLKSKEYAKWIQSEYFTTDFNKRFFEQIMVLYNESETLEVSRILDHYVDIKEQERIVELSVRTDALKKESMNKNLCKILKEIKNVEIDRKLKEWTMRLEDEYDEAVKKNILNEINILVKLKFNINKIQSLEEFNEE